MVGCPLDEYCTNHETEGYGGATVKLVMDNQVGGILTISDTATASK